MTRNGATERGSENKGGSGGEMKFDDNILTHLGRLTVFKTVLGYGSSGTIVFEGEYDKRKVAVKRILKV